MMSLDIQDGQTPACIYPLQLEEQVMVIILCTAGLPRHATFGGFYLIRSRQSPSAQMRSVYIMRG
jgi:hypothetical protein